MVPACFNMLYDLHMPRLFELGAGAEIMKEQLSCGIVARIATKSTPEHPNPLNPRVSDCLE